MKMKTYQEDFVEKRNLEIAKVSNLRSLKIDPKKSESSIDFYAANQKSI